MKSKVFSCLAIVVFLSTIALAADTSPWTDVCPNSDIPYCKNGGKTAYNAFGPKVLRDVKLGKIIGVAWRSKGSVIGYSKPIPEAGLPGETCLSPRDAYYYIIDDVMVDAQGRKKPPFLSQCREINAK